MLFLILLGRPLLPIKQLSDRLRAEKPATAQFLLVEVMLNRHDSVDAEEIEALGNILQKSMPIISNSLNKILARNCRAIVLIDFVQ